MYQLKQFLAHFYATMAVCRRRNLGNKLNERQEPVASWDDSQYSFNLVRSSFTGGFQIAVYLKSVNAEAELALAEAVKLDKQEWPLREAKRQKKEIDDREVARQKNQKSFRP